MSMHTSDAPASTAHGGGGDGTGLRRFQFLQELASGGFGSVYLAKMIPPDGPAHVVAIKLLHRRWTDNAEIASRMRDEARLLGRLRHENIVEVVDFAVIDGRAAMVMEVLEAVDVRVILDDAKRTHTPMPLAVAARVAAAVSRALDAAYNRPPSPGARPLRVIHRDIKPSNVMIDGHGRVKVLDFGVARAEFDAREAKTAELAFGSLEYMPPERLFFEPESAASDVYSVGTLLYEMLMLDKLGKAKLRQSEQDKFLAERLADLIERHPIGAPELEADAVAVLRDMLAFDDSRRPAAADAADRLEALAARCPPPTLEAWSAGVVPPLVDASRGRQAGGTLVGETLTEDPPETSAPNPWRAGFDGAEIIDADPDSDEVDLGPPALATGAFDRLPAPEDVETAYHTELHPLHVQDEPPTEASIDRTGADGDLDRTARDDTRWLELKQRTLDSLNETAKIDGRGSPAQPDPRRNRPSPQGGRDNPLDWLELDDVDDGPPTTLEPGHTRLDDFDAEGAPTVRMDGEGPETELALIELHPPAIVDDRPRSAREREAPREPRSSGAPVHVHPEADTVMVPGLDGPGARTARVSPSSSRASPSAPPAVSRAAPSAPPAAAPAAPSTGASASAGPTLYLFGSSMMLMASLAILLSVVILSAVGLYAMSGPRAPAAGAPVAVAPPIAVEPVSSGAPGAHGARFRSQLEGTRRMMVRCGDNNASGLDEVFVGGSGWAECTVTAIDGSRHRRTAVVAQVEARSYRCFGPTAPEGCD